MKENTNHGSGGRKKRDPASDFPLREAVEDFSGKARSFLIRYYETGLGFTVRAEEERADGMGYEFGAFSETSPYSALGRLRSKMYRALATRHLGGRRGGYHMLHDTLSGRISSDGAGGVVLVVDGKPLHLDDLARILATHEGWAFRLEIVDSLE